jgi:AcrR family transcriptional regulator
MSFQNQLQTGRRAFNRADNRAAILQAARQVFAELGFGGATVRDIIRRTNLATGTFYNYFDSKESVFSALNDEIGTELRAKLSEARHAASTFEQFVENSFYTYFTYYADNPDSYWLIRSNRGRGGHNSVMPGPQVQAGLEEMRKDIEAAMSEGVVPQLDVDYLNASLGGVAFAVLDEMMERKSIDPQAAARFASRLIMAGVDGFDGQSGAADASVTLAANGS